MSADDLRLAVVALSPAEFFDWLSRQYQFRRPPKRKGAAPERTAPESKLFGLVAEITAGRKPERRRCSPCGCFVGNSNIGGYSGRGPLSCPLFCLKCVDRAVGVR
jgi:hypothetical protein